MRFILVLSLLLTGCTSAEVTQRRFAVLRIVDGDTFVIRYDGEPTKVRILGIDTPERGELGYDEATNALQSFVDAAGGTVRLRLSGPRKRDNFGRLLAEVYAGCVDVGAAMLESGLADRYGDR